MEFDILRYFKKFREFSINPSSPSDIGTALFLSGNSGPAISPHIDQYSQKAKMQRRDFLKTSLGFSGVMLAVNQATGMRFFEVNEAEAVEPAANQELSRIDRDRSSFVVDVHSHLCTRPGHYKEGVSANERGMWFISMLDNIGKNFGLPKGTEQMDIDNFGKLVFQQSDTTIAICNNFGFREDYGGKDMVPIEYQAQLRDRWPDRTRILAGGLTPNHGVPETLDRLQQYAEKFKISGVKFYTCDSTPKRGWYFDDEKLAYPIWQKCRELGLKNIGCHKGIPFAQFYARYNHVEDFDMPADDFPDLNFIAYHSAWPYHQELAALKAFKPHRKNLYCEIGSTFAATVTSRPMECAHVLGTLLRDLDPDHVMWGTDSIIWGSPQWQITAFRKFQIPDQLVEGYGYPKLTDEIKRKVLGENAARIWNLDKLAAVNAQNQMRID